jgi:hypothetical protein
MIIGDKETAMTNKSQLELNLELRVDSHDMKTTVKMRKYVETGFIPQHGMEIIDSGIAFRVKSIAMAGLQELKHVANPDYRSPQGLVKITRAPDEKWLNEKVNSFKNQGWSVVK